MVLACPQAACQGQLAQQAPWRCEQCRCISLRCKACEAHNRPEAATCTSCGVPFFAAHDLVRPLEEAEVEHRCSLPFAAVDGLWLRGHANGLWLGQGGPSQWLELGPQGWALQPLPWRSEPHWACGRWFLLDGDQLRMLWPHQVEAVAHGALSSGECQHWGQVEALVAVHPHAIWIRRRGALWWADAESLATSEPWKPWPFPSGAQAWALSAQDLLWHDPSEGRLAWSQREPGGEWKGAGEATQAAWVQALASVVSLAEGRAALQWAGGQLVQLRSAYGLIKEEPYPADMASNFTPPMLLSLGEVHGALSLRSQGLTGLAPFETEALPAFNRRMNLTGLPWPQVQAGALWVAPRNDVGRQELIRLEMTPQGWALPWTVGEWTQVAAFLPVAGRAFVVHIDSQQGCVVEVRAWA